MTMPGISPALLDEVAAALPTGDGLQPAEIHARVGRWSAVTIRHALRQLVDEGRATFTGPDTRRRYCRVETGDA